MNIRDDVQAGYDGTASDRWHPHVTVACIAKRADKYLMVRERSRDGSVINQPAGHLECGESLIEAVIRETREETGWEFAPSYISGIYQFVTRNDDTYLRFTFFGKLIKLNKNYALDSAIEEVVWLSRPTLENNLKHLRSRVVLKCIADFENGNQLPLHCVQQLAPAK